jgi:uncharacterized protein YjbI with pentapeptide repeats
VITSHGEGVCGARDGAFECAGQPTGQGQPCILHSSVAVFDQALSQLATGGDLSFLAGATVNDNHLQQILSVIPVNSAGQREIRAPNCSGTEFQSDMLLDRYRIVGPATFVGATFHGVVSFGYCDLIGSSDFSGSVFLGDTSFSRSRFTAHTDFSGATFSRRADFSQVSAARHLTFVGARFLDFVTFESFGADDVQLDWATFYGEVRPLALLASFQNAVVLPHPSR